MSPGNENSTITHTSRDQFRTLMAEFPTGVAVVTTFDAAGHPLGMTCSAACSVTVDPPTLLVCLREESPTLAAMLHSLRFTRNLLDHRAQATAELFASGAPRRFARVHWTTEPSGGGPHLSRDAHAIADCHITDRHPVGDHTIVIGEVHRVVHGQKAYRSRPLLYGRRTYATWPGGPTQMPIFS